MISDFNRSDFHCLVRRCAAFVAASLVVAGLELRLTPPAMAYQDLTPEQIQERCANIALRLGGAGQDPGVLRGVEMLRAQRAQLSQNLRTLVGEFNQATERGQAADFAGIAGGLAGRAADATVTYYVNQAKALRPQIQQARQSLADVTEQLRRLEQERAYLRTSQAALGCPTEVPRSKPGCLNPPMELQNPRERAEYSRSKSTVPTGLL